MDQDISKQDLIDKYLQNEMSLSEKQDFEKEMQSDIDLRETVKMQKMIIDEIRQREGFLRILNKADKPIIPMYTKVLAIAAIFIGLLILTFWQPCNYSNNTIFNKYFAVVPVSIHQRQNIIYQGLTLGEECEFDNLNDQECSEIKVAIILYKNKNFTQASVIFEKILNPLQKNYELSFYMTVSQLMSGRIRNGQNNLEVLCKVPSFIYHDKVIYYLALTYIKEGELSKARDLLRTIRKSGGEYSIEAEQILKKMRWF